jgi:hypothetical protein
MTLKYYYGICVEEQKKTAKYQSVILMLQLKFKQAIPKYDTQNANHCSRTLSYMFEGSIAQQQ